MAVNLIVLARKDLGAAWPERFSPVVRQSGFGRDTASTPANDAQKLGMVSERYRFSRVFEHSLCPRHSALDALTSGGVVESPASKVMVRPGFPEIPESVWGRPWTRVCSKAWRRSDA